MALHIAYVTMHYTVLEHDHGHWCNTCMLSTGVRAVVMFRVNNTRKLKTHRQCAECMGHDVTLTDAPRAC